jgi:glucose-1-phosphate cytidylyltransferase
MKCLILCGGRGIVDPETKKRIPKCLIKIGGKPIIWHVMKLFSSYGHTDFILSLGMGGDQIKNYFINAYEYLHDIEISLSSKSVKGLNKIPEENWKIQLVDTGKSALTGARIARCHQYLKHQSFFISYSDILSDVNLNKLVDFHKKNNKILTVTGVNPPSKFGTFFLKDNNVTDYQFDSMLDLNSSKINGGFMIAESSLFNILSPISECNLETEIFDELTIKEEVALYIHRGFWQNVDTERDQSILNKLYENNKRPWLGIN